MAFLVEMRKQKALLSVGLERDFYIFSIPTWKNKNPRAGNSYERSVRNDLTSFRKTHQDILKYEKYPVSGQFL